MASDVASYRQEPHVTTPTTAPESPSESPRERTSTRWLIAAATIVILSVAILAIGAFATGREGGSVAGPASARDHTVTAPASGQQEGRFEILSGAETVVVRCADVGVDLYRATTPQDASLVPQVTQNGDLTQLSLVSSGTAGPATAEVVLSASVRWHLTMAGGGMTQRIECAEGNLSGVELGQGAGTIEASLPPARGTTVIRLLGGAGRLTIHLPKGLPVQAKVGNGAGIGLVTIDGQTQNDVKPGSDLTSPAWEEATDRYLIETPGGLASLIVDRRA